MAETVRVTCTVLCHAWEGGGTHRPDYGYVQAWRALEELQRDGVVKSIGVSNFGPHHIDRVLEAGTVAPAVNQVRVSRGGQRWQRWRV